MKTKRTPSAPLLIFIMFFLAAAILFPLNLFAGDAEPADKKTEAKEERDLGEWWVRNALKYDPLPEEYLHHFELKYQYNRDTGNLYRDNHMVNAAYIVRKWRFTNYLIYEFDKRFAGKPDTDLRDDVKHDLHEDFRFAITERLFASIGGFYQVDEIKEIEESTTFYAGLGYHLIDSQTMVLKLFGALGQRDIEYLYNSDYGFENMTESMVYIDQSFKWYLTRDLAFKEGVISSISIEDTDLYRYSLELSLNYRLMPHLFIEMTYSVEYENFIDPNLPSFIVDEIIKEDTSFSTGIKISF